MESHQSSTSVEDQSWTSLHIDLQAIFCQRDDQINRKLIRTEQRPLNEKKMHKSCGKRNYLQNDERNRYYEHSYCLFSTFNASKRY